MTDPAQTIREALLSWPVPTDEPETEEIRSAALAVLDDSILIPYDELQDARDELAGAVDKILPLLDARLREGKEI